jgi:hypothetical protein
VASAVIQPGNVVSVNLIMNLDAQIVMNTFHYYADPTGTAGTWTVSQFMTAWEAKVWQPSVVGANDGLNDMLMPDCTDAKLVSQLVYGAGSRSRAEVYLLSPDDGSYPTGNPLPSGAAAVVQRVGTAAGRKYQGRIYIPGLSTGNVSASKLTPTFFTLLQTWGDRASLPIVTGAGPTLVTMQNCLWKPGGPPLPGAIGLLYNVTAPVRYQRRREVGVGQ